MSRFRKKPVVVEAVQWFGHGPVEGDPVRYYRTPAMDGQTPCDNCGVIMHEHGWIDERVHGSNVCPGDWIITMKNGEHFPVKPDIFDATYEPAPDDASA